MKTLLLLGTMLLFMALAPQTCVGQLVERKIFAGQPPDSPWVPIPAQEVYAAYWDKDIACMDVAYGPDGAGAGMVRPTPYTTLDKMNWFVAGDSLFLKEGRTLYGVFVPPDTIVLAGLRMMSERLVRHEMLHAMGVKYHPLVPYHSCGLFDGLYGRGP